MDSFTGIVEGSKVVFEDKESCSKIVQPKKALFGGRVLIKQDYCPDQVTLERRRLEVQLLQSNPHTCICKCTGCKVEPHSGGGYSFHILLPLVGKILEAEHKERRDKPGTSARWEEEELWKYLEQMVSACAFLQEHSTAHRDIKPANILYGERVMKLTNFHSLKKFGGEERATLLGSERYCSPAIRKVMVDGDSNIDRAPHIVFKSDVYSLGIVFLELSMLELPENLTNLAGLKELLENSLDNMRKNARYTPEWIRVLEKMLQYEERDRPDFLELRNFLQIRSEALSQRTTFSSEPREISLPQFTSLRCTAEFSRVAGSLDRILCTVRVSMQRSPIICVIDQSGSMAGSPLKFVKAALHILIDSLSSEDRIQIVGFSDTAQNISGMMNCTPGEKQMLRRSVDAIELLDATNILEGLRRAMEIAQSMGTHSAVSVLLFTNGRQNCPQEDRSYNKVLEMRSAENTTVCCIALDSETDEDLLKDLTDRSDQFIKVSTVMLESALEKFQQILQLPSHIQAGLMLKPVFIDGVNFSNAFSPDLFQEFQVDIGAEQKFLFMLQLTSPIETPKTFEPLKLYLCREEQKGKETQLSISIEDGERSLPDSVCNFGEMLTAGWKRESILPLSAGENSIMEAKTIRGLMHMISQSSMLAEIPGVSEAVNNLIAE